MGGEWQNWGRTATVRPVRVERPRTVDAVQRAVDAARRHGLRVKAVGSGHSFTAIAAAPDVLLDLGDLSGLTAVDPDSRRVTLKAGTRLADIPRLIRPHGLAMANLGDVDVQTLAGAISTGTHGTGAAYGGLSAQVVGATLVTADGTLLTVDEHTPGDLLGAVALGLGALGVLVEVILQCVPAFVLHALDRPEGLEPVLESVAQRFANADHFEFYWFPHTDRALTRTNTRLPGDAARHPLSAAGRWVDDRLVGTALHQVAVTTGHLLPAAVPAINRLTTRVWGDREFTDWSHRVFPSVRAVRFQEMEYAIAADSVAIAVDAIRDAIERGGWRISFPIEVRMAAADDVWLSTAYGRHTAYIAVHRFWRDGLEDYFDAVEQILLALGGRPHWGKLHSLTAGELRQRHPRYDDFLAVRDRLDPDRRFANDHLDRVLGP